jgi:adenosylmethionine-8-amino-7-oxononanoate aminotransferase
MTDSSGSDLQSRAQRHLWMHFTRQPAVGGPEIPIITKGEGCWIWDQHGRRIFDGLSGLFTVQVGHGRRELGEAAAHQMGTLAFFPVWTYAHEPAIELASRLAAMAPGDLDRVFLTGSGSEAVESAWKFARQYFAAIGQPRRTKVISRNIAYHGTTMGALSLTGIAPYRTPFEPLVPGVARVQPPYPFRCRSCSGTCSLACADDIESVIEMEGPDTVAAVYLEPVQNAGGAFTPPEGYFQRVREICDRHGILLVSDEVICAFGRLGHWFGYDRYGYRPDIVTFAKGVTSGYAPLGGMIVSERLAEPFVGTGHAFLHGMTFGGHPSSCAVALANLDLMEREDVLGNVQRLEDRLTAMLASLTDIPLVGEVRGAGFFRAIELVPEQGTKQTFDEETTEWLLRGLLSPRLFELGLYCRADDRGEPVIVLAPPLVATEDELGFMTDVLRQALTEASEALHARRR